MSPTLRNGLLLVLLIAILGAAGWLFTRGKKETVLPKTGWETHWMCEKCHRHFDLSPQQSREWMESKDKIRRDPNFPASLIVFWCPDCKAYSVVRAQIDPANDEWIIQRDSSGNFIAPPSSKAPAAKESEKQPK